MGVPHERRELCSELAHSSVELHVDFVKGCHFLRTLLVCSAQSDESLELFFFFFGVRLRELSTQCMPSREETTKGSKWSICFFTFASPDGVELLSITYYTKRSPLQTDEPTCPSRRVAEPIEDVVESLLDWFSVLCGGSRPRRELFLATRIESCHWGDAYHSESLCCHCRVAPSLFTLTFSRLKC